MERKQVALVTGASSGIGWQTAIEMRREGFCVYGAARRLEKLEELHSWGVIPVRLDVTDDASMTSCVERIISEAGHVDVLVNCAGYGSYGPIEEVPLAEARQEMEVNVFGLARLTQLVLPHMRSSGAGRIINVSSVAGRVWTPFGGWYHASKFAVEGFTHALRWELEPLGIKAILIEPGLIKTDWGQIAANHLKAAAQGSAYADEAETTAQMLELAYGGHFGTVPEEIARCIARAAVASKPKARYMLGRGAWPLFLLKALLPPSVYDGVLRWSLRHMGAVFF